MMVKTWNELEQMTTTIVGVTYNMADLQSITVGFWEGGSVYWIKLAEIHHPILTKKPRGMATSEWAFDALLNGGSIDFTPCDTVEEEGEKFSLTMEKYRAGLQMFIEKRMKERYPVSHAPPPIITGGILDAGNVDANDADTILQYALFKEGVFG